MKNFFGNIVVILIAAAGLTGSIYWYLKEKEWLQSMLIMLFIVVLAASLFSRVSDEEDEEAAEAETETDAEQEELAEAEAKESEEESADAE